MQNWKDRDWKDSPVAKNVSVNASLSSHNTGRWPPCIYNKEIRSLICFKTGLKSSTLIQNISLNVSLSSPISFRATISLPDQCCFNAVDQRSNNVDWTLKMKQNPTSDFQRCTSRYNVGVRPWNNVESTLHNVDTIAFKHCTTLFLRCFNDDVALSQSCFNVASTSVKAISKSIWLVKKMDFQKDW